MSGIVYFAVLRENLAYTTFLFVGSLTLRTTAVVNCSEFKCYVKTPCECKMGLKRIFEVKSTFEGLCGR